jgi:hypothetical protein
MTDSALKKKEDPKKKENKFEWADEGVATLVRVVILAWSGAILTLNYVTIPGVPQRQIDPTFIASVFTGTLATFGVQTAKKKDEEEKKEEMNLKFLKIKSLPSSGLFCL